MSDTKTASFGYTAKVVAFTIPVTGVYDIIAFGAQGGSSSAATGGPAAGGLGAEVSADFLLQAGTQLEILVGEQGAAASVSGAVDIGGGGGGGSFVASLNGTDTFTPIPLVVAGGGGGGANSTAGSSGAIGIAGAIGPEGTEGNGAAGGASGFDGSGGGGGVSPDFGGGGGGGFQSDGEGGAIGASRASGGGNGFITVLNGGTQTYLGGFGGGGQGGAFSGGGGGGFSGGGGGGLSGGGGGGGSFFANFASTATLTADVVSGNGLVEIEPICFVAGTCIATLCGELPVERLAAGDRALTHGGEARCITWIGHGRVLAPHCHRTAAAAVIVRKDAIADNVPCRDLHVTKGHSLYIDGVLIPVEFLINYRSIAWDERSREMSVYHIELDRHDVLIADGAPAESYRDDGNRWLFRNANRGWDLPPQEPCAPILTGGPMVDAVWRRLLDRAGPRPDLPLTGDPDLHLLVDGKRLDVAMASRGVHTFRLPATPGTVRIVSRAAAPAELGLARDPRVLGVAVRKVAVWSGTRLALIEANDDKLTNGFHGYEPDDGLRWTSGDAVLPPELFSGFTGPMEMDLHIKGTARYPLALDTQLRAAA